ncbi:MAG: hypothetical protein R6V27_14435 [Balneolaceae bacterium]
MDTDNKLEEDFKPKGAMAFFVALLIFFMVVYFSLYFLMLSWG